MLVYNCFTGQLRLRHDGLCGPSRGPAAPRRRRPPGALRRRSGPRARPPVARPSLLPSTSRALSPPCLQCALRVHWCTQGGRRHCTTGAGRSMVRRTAHRSTKAHRPLSDQGDAACVVRDSNSGHQLTLPAADWCPIFASRITHGGGGERCRKEKNGALSERERAGVRTACCRFIQLCP